MSPTIATLVFALGVTGFFLFDRDLKARTSKAIWIPVIWLLINGSRSVATWLSGQVAVKMQKSSQYLEGSPADMWTYVGLMAAGLVILTIRKAGVASLLRRNSAILVFFAYCALSTLWSDYTDISLKRWIKAVG